MHYIFSSDGEFKLLRIRELDNVHVDGKPDHTDEDTPPNFRSGHWLHHMKYKSM